MKKIFPRHLAAIAALSVLLTGGIAYAGDAPAVSELNGKAAIAGNYHDQKNMAGEEYSGLFLGSLTAPLTHDFGFQADTVLGSRDGNSLAGIGGHLFWRDPAKGLVGITGSYLGANYDNGAPDHNVTRFGGEAELYHGQFTLALTSGYQNGQNVEDGYYGSAIGYWYANDNLRLGIGAAKDPVLDTSGLADVEFQPGFASMPGMTFFAKSTFGKDDYVSAQAGIRFYFGKDKNLKLRNREDDPMANLPGDTVDSSTANDPVAACLARGPYYFWRDGLCRHAI
tara:strand:- start:1151 stop:1996 length:846 start_codon:yes stop_codon:yes gene_type:complete